MLGLLRMNDNNFQILINKLDKFIRKYYLNKIIKGVLLALAVFATWYLIIIIAEYFGRFSTTFRTTLFAITVFLYAIIFIFLILIPVLKLFKIGKTIDYKFASNLIGKYFPDVSDKLLNTLELKEMSDKNPAYSDLIIAGIEQRTINLNPIPFVSAINLKKNTKYLKYFAPPIVIILLLLIFYPNMVSEATERIVNYSTFYKEPAPFEYKILNDSLIAKKGKDFTLEIKTEGRVVPDNVTITYGGNDFFMEKIKNGNFKYNFRNLNNNITFSLSSINIKSDEYKIEVLPAPTIIDFKIVVVPPAYTGEEVKTFNNTGDLTVPIGSMVSWSFNTSNIEQMNVVFDSTVFELEKKDKQFAFSKNIIIPINYSISAKNKYFNENFGINYKINVIPDLYPSIEVKSRTDSSQIAIIYFNGYIDDDYGFSSLTFNCIPGEKSDSLIKINIPFAKNTTFQEYYFAFDFGDVPVKGHKISYYFEVGDNDAVHGAKYTKTQMQEFSIPTADDLKEMTAKANKETESKMDEAQKLSKQIRKDVDALKKKVVSEKMNSWERTQAMQQILNEQNKLENLMDEIKKIQNETHNYKENFAQNENLLKKQEEINKMFDALMDDEMKKMLEEMQKLMDNFNPEDFLKLSEKMNFTTEQLEKEMDNTLELLKKSEVEENFKKVAEDLKNLADDQKKLAEQTDKKELSKEQLADKQKQMQEQFKEIQKELQEILEKNQELNDPYKIDDFQQESKEIQDEMQQSEQDIREGKNSKANKSQKKSAEKMQEMADKIDSAMDADAADQAEENMEDIRQLIENLLYFSFAQENIMTKMKSISNRDPKYKSLLVEQKNLKDHFESIKDSINSLAGRVPMLGQLTKKEIFNIHDNFAKVMDDIFTNKANNVQSDQQFIMTSANNLTLLLLEMLQQMQQQQADQQQQKQGGACKNCNNPQNAKGSKPGTGNKQKQMGEMRDKQEGLKRQMKDMLENMKNGQGQGQKMNKQSSEQLAKMLMQQEMLKQMLQEMQNGTSSDQAKQLKEIERLMDENLKDLINGNVTPTTINRQDQILTRLLQAENSEREREIDNKRKSTEAKNYKLSNPDEIFKDKEKEIHFKELLQLDNVKLKPYYKEKYKDYLKNL